MYWRGWAALLFGVVPGVFVRRSDFLHVFFIIPWFLDAVPGVVSGRLLTVFIYLQSVSG